MIGGFLHFLPLGEHSMRWSNVGVIFRREVRDQIRDRRTLFMIFVLPILLYPFLGYGALKFAATLEQKPRVVVVVGAENLPKSPPLLNPERSGFDPTLFERRDDAERLVVRLESSNSPWGDPARRKEAIHRGEASAALVVPRDLAEQLRRDAKSGISITYNSVDEPSQITNYRLRDMLDRWKTRIVDLRLKQDGKPESYAEPIGLRVEDVATPGEVGSSVWSRIFPFLLVVMALTGAFYPAVDLCAGEKERGTMETLLISPASRSEIVMGKFLTVMLASVLTALLNLVSMGLTGLGMALQFGAVPPSPARRAAGAAAVTLAAPTLQAAVWMLILLIPLAAFFGAVCLALAVLARSMKEGQYYMTPLYLVSMPLIFLSLAPEIELDLFYSLVPITGVALLLRALILGSYDVAFRYFLPVLLPMLVYAAVALRWAIDQFQREDVLFREAERFSFSTWLRHLYRDREPTPTGSQALLCFALILSLSWYLIMYFGGGAGLGDIVLGQLFIAIPPVLMAVFLTSSPSRTLRLAWPRGRYWFTAVALALALNPLVAELEPIVQRLFPISATLKAALAQLLGPSTSLGMAVIVFALVPAVCEELAFRGFILSGLERQHRTRSAVLLSALMFGFLHVLMSLFQQLFNATLLGIVLGLLAVRSRSILPGIAFHFFNNAMGVARGALIERGGDASFVGWIYRNPSEGLYHVIWVVAGAILSAGLLYALWKQKPDPLLRPEDPVQRPVSLAQRERCDVSQPGMTPG
jgi:sodium transport system permease protein